jgi:hypothetical protein
VVAGDIHAEGKQEQSDDRGQVERDGVVLRAERAALPAFEQIDQ